MSNKKYFFIRFDTLCVPSLRNFISGEKTQENKTLFCNEISKRKCKK